MSTTIAAGDSTSPPLTDLVPPAGAATPRSFAALGVSERLCASLASNGITEPFPIQAAALPDALAGRDVLARGRTGSGKTVAFAVPVVAALAASGRPRTPKRPRALVLVPTRELAAQVARVFTPLAATAGLRVQTVFGGVNQAPQVAALRQGIDVLVACPGRLEDLVGQGQCRLDAVEITVIDEADHMADLGFLPPVRRLLDLTKAGTQRLLFSATLDGGVDVIVRRYLHNPVTHSVDPVGPPPEMAHHVLAVTAADKAGVVRQLAGGHGRSLFFTRTKHQAKKLAQTLSKSGIPATELHSNLSQAVRSRNLAAFADGSARVMVATDIAARGIHVDEIAVVVHLDPPADPKAYLHRSGRTGRAGADGTVVTLMTPEQRGDVRTLSRKAGINPLTTKVAPGDRHIVTLVGPPAPLVEWTAPRVPAAAPARRAGYYGQRSGSAGRPAAAGSGGRGRSGRSYYGDRPARSR